MEFISICGHCFEIGERNAIVQNGNLMKVKVIYRISIEQIRLQSRKDSSTSITMYASLDEVPEEYKDMINWDLVCDLVEGSGEESGG